MGFHEDDRIRNKNLVYNTAHDLYDAMIKTGLTPEEIVKTYELTLKNSSGDRTRDEIISTIIKIARRSNESENTDS